MSGNVVILILGTLVLAYGVYFTHTVVRPKYASGDDQAAAANFQLGPSGRKQVSDEARAAGLARDLSGSGLDADVDRAAAALAAAGKLRGGRCLWVEHDPDSVVHERRMIELLRVEIDLARTSNQAVQALVGRRYDFIVTGLTRPVASGGVDDRAGIKLLKLLAGAPNVPPSIVYAEQLATDDDGSELPAAPADDDAADDAAADGDADEAEGDAAPGPADDAVEQAVVVDPRLDDARAAGARAAVSTPSALLHSVLDLLGADPKA